MAELSNAEQYFQKVTSPEHGYGYLEKYPSGNQPETEWLECKGCEKLTEKQIPTIWSEALSGFANTGGGVLIWGLDARKDENGIDRVVGLSLAPDAELLASRLKELQVQSIDPPTAGIQIVVLKKEDEKAGFVVCYVPEGKAKPHRAESAGRNYYIRIGTSFVIPPVSLLRSLFYPTSRAYLVPSVVIHPQDAKGSPVMFWFCVKNIGSLTARSISVVINHPESMHFGVSRTEKIRMPEQLHAHIPLELVAPINPQMNCQGFFNLHVGSHQMIEEPFTFVLKVSCEDAPAEIWSRQITHDDCMRMGNLEFTLETK